MSVHPYRRPGLLAELAGSLAVCAVFAAADLLARRAKKWSRR